MKLSQDNLQEIIFDYFEQIKTLISPDIWESVLLDCTKNELLTLFLLYRNQDVNMSMVADYIHVPLNTVTGIVGRMEKKEMVQRERSTFDKRIVTITLTPVGKQQITSIVEQCMQYGTSILSTLTAEELTLAGTILDKVISILGKDSADTNQIQTTKIKKIEIL